MPRARPGHHRGTTRPRGSLPGAGAAGAPRVSIVIPNWNGESLLPTCLASIRRQTFQDLELILVDNGSTDRSVELARAAMPSLRLVAFPENRGFSPAVNAGIRAARGCEIALLNSDVELTPRWLEALVQALDAHPEVSACASKMLSARDHAVVDGVGMACLAGGIGYRLGAHEPDRGQYDTAFEVLGPCAGAALYRRTLFETVGLFDEAFFAYHEDVDLVLRARWAGLRCLFVPAAVAYHVGGGASGGRLGPLVARLSTRNRYAVVVKNLPVSMILRGLPAMLCYEALWARRLAGEGLLGAYLRGLREGLGQLGAMWRQRRRIRQLRRVSVAAFRRTVRDSERMALESLVRRYAHRPVLARLLRGYARWGWA